MHMICTNMHMILRICILMYGFSAMVSGLRHAEQASLVPRLHSPGYIISQVISARSVLLHAKTTTGEWSLGIRLEVSISGSNMAHTQWNYCHSCLSL